MTKEVRVDDTGDQQQRTRSGSFGSAIRRIFSPSKATALTPRGGSLNRPAPPAAQADVKRESSVPAVPATKDTLSPYGSHLAPTGAQQQEGGYQRPRQGTPVPVSSTQHSARWDS